MNDSYVTVYDIVEVGYRGMPWALGLGIFFICVVIYLISLKIETKGDKAYRNGLFLLLLLGITAFCAYHVPAFQKYMKYADQLGNGDAEIIIGHIAALNTQGYFLLIDVDGKRLRSSKFEKPYYLGFHAEDFQLKNSFLIKASLVDDVIVRLQVHNMHF